MTKPRIGRWRDSLRHPGGGLAESPLRCGIKKIGVAQAFRFFAFEQTARGKDQLADFKLLR